MHAASGAEVFGDRVSVWLVILVAFPMNYEEDANLSILQRAMRPTVRKGTKVLVWQSLVSLTEFLP